VESGDGETEDVEEEEEDEEDEDEEKADGYGVSDFLEAGSATADSSS